MISKILLERIINATKKFISEEKTLLDQDAHEESISGLYVNYLKTEFKDFPYDIDTQYNKRIIDNKVVEKYSNFLASSLPNSMRDKSIKSDQTRVDKKFMPDIIFHDRESANHNFLMIEIKKSTNKKKNERHWDHIKLSEMTKGDLDYTYGLFIDFTSGAEFNRDRPCKMKLYQNGNIIKKIEVIFS